MSEIYDFTLKAGATNPPLEIDVVNENNSAVDMTGYKGIDFFMRHEITGALILGSVAGEVTDSVAGQMQFNWTVGSTSGLDNTPVLCTFRLTLSDNELLKVPDSGYITGYIGDTLS